MKFRYDLIPSIPLN